MFARGHSNFQPTMAAQVHTKKHNRNFKIKSRYNGNIIFRAAKRILLQNKKAFSRSKSFTTILMTVLIKFSIKDAHSILFPPNHSSLGVSPITDLFVNFIMFPLVHESNLFPFLFLLGFLCSMGKFLLPRALPFLFLLLNRLGSRWPEV